MMQRIQKLEEELVESLFNEKQIDKHREAGFIREDKLLPIQATDEELER